MNSEYLIYGIVVVAVAAMVFAFRGGSDPYAFAREREEGWKQLPLVFKLLWNVATLFESTVGAMVAAWLPRKKSRIARNIPASALPLTPERVLCCSAFLGLGFGILGLVGASCVYAAKPTVSLVLPLGVFLALFLMGWFWPTQNLAHYTEERQEMLVRQLPFAIDLIGAAMRSGLDFGASLRYYTGLGVGGPLQEEFGRVLADISLGSPISRALKDMADRVGVEVFTSFAGVVAYGADVGAPITQTLKVHGAELRRSRFALAERKAARAPIIMIIPLVLCIMPSVFIVILTPLIMRFMASH